MINVIVLAVIHITEKIDNYCFNNFLVEEKIINYVEKLRTFKKLEI